MNEASKYIKDLHDYIKSRECYEYPILSNIYSFLFHLSNKEKTSYLLNDEEMTDCIYKALDVALNEIYIDGTLAESSYEKEYKNHQLLKGKEKAVLDKCIIAFCNEASEYRKINFEKKIKKTYNLENTDLYLSEIFKKNNLNETLIFVCNQNSDFLVQPVLKKIQELINKQNTEIFLKHKIQIIDDFKKMGIHILNSTDNLDTLVSLFTVLSLKEYEEEIFHIVQDYVFECYENFNEDTSELPDLCLYQIIHTYDKNDYEVNLRIFFLLYYFALKKIIPTNADYQIIEILDHIHISKGSMMKYTTACSIYPEYLKSFLKIDNFFQENYQNELPEYHYWILNDMMTYSILELLNKEVGENSENIAAYNLGVSKYIKEHFNLMNSLYNAASGFRELKMEKNGYLIDLYYSSLLSEIKYRSKENKYQEKINEIENRDIFVTNIEPLLEQVECLKKEKEKLENIINQKNVHIMDLKATIKDYKDKENFFKENETETDDIEEIPEETVEEIAQRLKDKNITFIGECINYIKKMQKVFPEWNYITQDTLPDRAFKRLLEVDYVLLCTDFMGHSLYNKFKKLSSKKNYVFLKGCNLNNIILSLKDL